MNHSARSLFIGGLVLSGALTGCAMNADEDSQPQQTVSQKSSDQQGNSPAIQQSNPHVYPRPVAASRPYSDNTNPRQMASAPITPVAPTQAQAPVQAPPSAINPLPTPQPMPAESEIAANDENMSEEEEAPSSVDIEAKGGLPENIKKILDLPDRTEKDSKKGKSSRPRKKSKDDAIDEDDSQDKRSRVRSGNGSSGVYGGGYGSTPGYGRGFSGGYNRGMGNGYSNFGTGVPTPNGNSIAMTDPTSNSVPPHADQFDESRETDDLPGLDTSVSPDMTEPNHHPEQRDGAVDNPPPVDDLFNPHHNDGQPEHPGIGDDEPRVADPPEEEHQNDGPSREEHEREGGGNTVVPLPDLPPPAF